MSAGKPIANNFGKTSAALAVFAVIVIYSPVSILISKSLSGVVRDPPTGSTKEYSDSPGVIPVADTSTSTIETFDL
jgi:hypothetical protein